MSEVKNSAKLSHPNIVTAFYAGADKGYYYLAISYVTGKTVEDIQAEEGKFEEKRALKVILSIVDALEYAWNEFKILHRDIKPANIMINKRGEAMLLDLGIAKNVEEESNLTMTGTVVGTPYYISPEQAMAVTDIDFRADIYSLGTTLYHMVTGTVPYNATTAMAIIMKHINDEFPAPTQFNSEISAGCTALIKKMMAKEREERHSSWSELRKDIELVLDGKMPASNISDTDTVVDKTTATSSHNETKETKPKEENSKPDNSSKILKIAGAIAVVIILILCVVAGGAYFYFSHNSSSKEGKTPFVGPVMPKIEVNNSTSASQNHIIPDKPVKQPTVQELKNSAIDNDPVAGGYNKFCENLLNSTSVTRKAFWAANANKEVTWSGKVVDVKGRSGKYEIHLNNPMRENYKGFNLILISYTSDGSVPALKMGENIVFTGNIYNFRLKSNGVVIVYLKNVIINSSK